MTTLCILMIFSIWFDRISLGWFTVHIKGSQVRISKVRCSLVHEDGSSVVSALAFGARGPRFDPCLPPGKLWCPNTLSLVSFAGMTLVKCIVLQIGTLTGCPLCRESHLLCRLKNPTMI